MAANEIAGGLATDGQSLSQLFVKALKERNDDEMTAILQSVMGVKSVAPVVIAERGVLAYLEEKAEQCDNFNSLVEAFWLVNNTGAHIGENAGVKAFEMLMEIIEPNDYLNLVEYARCIELMREVVNYWSGHWTDARSTRFRLMLQYDQHYLINILQHLTRITHRILLCSQCVLWISYAVLGNEKKMRKFWELEFADLRFGNEKKTALQIAADTGNLVLLRFLYEMLQGRLFQDLQFGSSDCLVRSLQENHEMFASELLSYCDDVSASILLNARGDFHYTPLHIACSKNNEILVQSLIRKKALYNSFNRPRGVKPRDLCKEPSLIEFFDRIDKAFISANHLDLEARDNDIKSGEEGRLIWEAVDATSRRSAEATLWDLMKNAE